MKTICFVCTGNIFRSVSAEYSLRKLKPGCKVSSAGIIAKPEVMHPITVKTLKELGMDSSKHVQRKLSQEIVDENDLVVAIAMNHKEYIKKNFDIDVPLFSEIAFGVENSILDIGDVIVEPEKHSEEEAEFVKNTVEYIYRSMPEFIENLGKYFKK